MREHSLSYEVPHFLKRKEEKKTTLRNRDKPLEKINMDKILNKHKFSVGMWGEEERRFEKHTNRIGRINYCHFLF